MLDKKMGYVIFRHVGFKGGSGFRQPSSRMENK